jgi:DNA-damage-inducible protein J
VHLSVCERVYIMYTQGVIVVSAIVNVRINPRVKREASKVLGAYGMTTSGAIRMFLMRIVEDRALPFDPTRPNKETLKALKAARAGKTLKAKDLDELQKQLKGRK